MLDLKKIANFLKIPTESLNSKLGYSISYAKRDEIYSKKISYFGYLRRNEEKMKEQMKEIWIQSCLEISEEIVTMYDAKVIMDLSPDCSETKTKLLEISNRICLEIDALKRIINDSTDENEVQKSQARLDIIFPKTSKLTSIMRNNEIVGWTLSTDL